MATMDLTPTNAAAARWAASVRLCTPSLRYALLRWNFTV